MMEPGEDTEGIRVGEFVGRLFGKKLESAELLRYRSRGGSRTDYHEHLQLGRRSHREEC